MVEEMDGEKAVEDKDKRAEDSSKTWQILPKAADEH